jgi:hypothetical protein
VGDALRIRFDIARLAYPTIAFFIDAVSLYQPCCLQYFCHSSLGLQSSAGLQRVNAQLEASKPAPQTVLNH